MPNRKKCLLRSSSTPETTPNLPSYSAHHEDRSVVCVHAFAAAEPNKQTNKFRGAGSASTNPNNRQPNADHKPAKGPTPAPEASNNEHVWPQDCPGLGSASSQQPLQLLSRFDGLTSARRQQPDDRVDQDGATEWNARN